MGSVKTEEGTFFNEQSTMTVIYGRNKSCLTTNIKKTLAIKVNLCNREREEERERESERESESEGESVHVTSALARHTKEEGRRK